MGLLAQVPTLGSRVKEASPEYLLVSLQRSCVLLKQPFSTTLRGLVPQTERRSSIDGGCP